MSASACYLVISLLPRSAAQFLCALLPLASMGLYRIARRNDASQLRQQQRRRQPRVASHFPKRLVLIALFFGCSFGAMKGLMSPITAQWANVRDLLNIVGILTGVAALYLSTNVLRLDFNHLTYQVALPLMAAGFLFLPFHEPASVIGTAVHQCGYQYFYIVLWSTWPIIREARRRGPRRRRPGGRDDPLGKSGGPLPARDRGLRIARARTHAQLHRKRARHRRGDGQEPREGHLSQDGPPLPAGCD